MIQNLSIRDLENLSGIKAHTIRMWEKRYDIFTPDRTDTNIRTYNHDDLKKLLNISTLLDHGMKISRASSLSSQEMYEEIDRISDIDTSNCNRFLINKLIVATLQCDIYGFNDTCMHLLKTMTVEECTEDVIYPLLKKIGVLWSVNKLYPAQEHFASQMIRQKLFTAIDGLPNGKSNKRFLLYLPDEERHELGLLYAYYLIKKAGHECIYLGADVPLDGVVECVKTSKPTHLLTLFITQRPSDILSDYLSELKTTFPKITVLLAGLGEDSCRIPDCKNLRVLHEIDDLKKQL